MKKMKFGEAVESAVAQAMANDKNIIILGEDVHTLRSNLFSRFGKERVKAAPISEGAFLGASVTASMLGLRPIVEIMIVDFIAVAIDGVLNHAAKNTYFSGNKWDVPLVIRTACGGGYGDAGQHEQSLWGWLAHIPGISVIVPSNPSDAGRLMITAIQENHPVVYLEHKLLAENWLDYMGKGGRKTVSFNVPEAGAYGEVPDSWEPIPMGTASIVQEGTDITFISLGVGVHRCKEAADVLKNEGITCEIIDLRFVKPLDKDLIIQSVKKTGNCVVVDEDYKEFGLSGEISAILSENGVKYNFGRVCTESTIPFSRNLEDEVIPNVKRILEETKRVLKK